MQAVLKESVALKALQVVQVQHGPVDLGMLERSAHALELLGRLVDSGVDLVFKGGTSLILRLQTIRRLSIDVDIIFNVSLAFCRHGLAKERDTDVAPCRLLEEGIGKMANYLVGSRFGRDESKIAASRAALLCHLLRIGECSGSLRERRFDPAKQEALGQIQIQWPHAALNKLISTTPEAFYYWAQIIKDLPGRKPSSSKWSQRGGQP